MSIFSKKSKPKDADVKTKQQQPVNQGAKPEQSRQIPKSGSAPVLSNGVLSAGDRTVQRAQIMAASRRRMNSDSPDYSIKGASKGHQKPHKASVSSSVVGEPAQAGSIKSSNVESPANGAKPTTQKLSKAQKPSKEARKSGNNSSVDVSKDASSLSTTIANFVSKPSSAKQVQEAVSKTGGPTSVPESVQRTPPLPMDSPTLGSWNSTSGEKGFPQPLPSSDSGYASAVTSRATSDSKPPIEVKTTREPRVDSGFIAKWTSSKESAQESRRRRRSRQEEKCLITSPSMKSDDRSARIATTYVSRLDPGPTASAFSDPLDASKVSPTSMDRPRPVKQKDTLPPSQATQERGRDISQKPAHSPGFLTPKHMETKPDTQISNETRAKPVTQMDSSALPHWRQAEPKPSPSHSIKARSMTPLDPSALPPWRQAEPKPSFPRSTRAVTPSPVRSPGLESHRETTRTYTLPASKASDSRPEDNQTAAIPVPPKPSNVEPHHGRSVQTSVMQPNAPGPESPRTALAAFHGLSEVRSPHLKKETSLQEMRTSQQPLSQFPYLESDTVNLSDTRPALPPISALEGFKVNKRGQVLDEEGEVIGELFEGDIIDCVRHKVNAYGDVIDEFGNAVGRARTVPRGQMSKPRLSVSSAAGSNYQFGSWQSERRESNASHSTLPYYQRAARASISHAAPTPVHENTIIAELDASTEAEASPVVDQSEIFSPFGKSQTEKRAESPSTITRKEVVPEQRQPSQYIMSPVGDEESSLEQKARRWTSRYFDPPKDGQTLARRSTLKPETPSTPTADSVFSPISPKVRSNSSSPARSRVVIGPTLESLLERSPSLFPTSDEVHASGSSTLTLTPNLPREAPRTEVRSPSPGPSQSGATTPRPPSIQLTSPASGVGPRSSVRSSYTHHQPIRKSPLASYETTPPGSGAGIAGEGKLGTMSLQPPTPRRFFSQSRKAAVDEEDAAPSPDVPVARARQKRLDPYPAKTVEKRKSRLSIMFGKKDSVIAAR